MPRKRKQTSTLAKKLTKTVAARKKKKKAAATKKKAAPRSNPRENPPIWTDAWEIVVPGVAAYTGTRLAGRIAYSLARKKSPNLAKHVGPLVSLAVAAAGWFLVHKIDSLKKYHTPVVVGASIAAVQGILQTYIPQYGWILNDYHMNDALPANAAPAALPENQAPPLPEPTSDDSSLDSFLEEGESMDDLYGGNFAGGWTN